MDGGGGMAPAPAPAPRSGSVGPSHYGYPSTSTMRRTLTRLVFVFFNLGFNLAI